MIQGMETDYAFQIIVDEVVNEDERFHRGEALPLEEKYRPIDGSHVCFFLGDLATAGPLQVDGYMDGQGYCLSICAGEAGTGFFTQAIIHKARKGKALTCRPMWLRSRWTCIPDAQQDHLVLLRTNRWRPTCEPLA